MPLEWNKSWGRKCLYGSMRADSEAERGIWHDLMDIAFCISPKFGYLEKYLDIPYTLDQISIEFNINREMLQAAVEKFKNEGRLQCDDNNCFVITNTNRYQVLPLGTVPHQQQKALLKFRELLSAQKYVKSHKNYVMVDTKTGEIEEVFYNDIVTKAIRQFKKENYRIPTIDEVMEIRKTICAEGEDS